MSIDRERAAEIGLAILSLTASTDRHGTTRAWKGIDWDLLALMHDRGWIGDPVSKAKSVVLTDEGLATAAVLRGQYLEPGTDLSVVEVLEEGMWTCSKRGDEKWFDRHVHADFVEVGRSGRLYSRSDFFPVDIQPFEARVPLPRFRARCLAPDCVMTTYDSELRNSCGVELTHRSSVWRYVDDRWQLLYHQGTPFEV